MGLNTEFYMESIGTAPVQLGLTDNEEAMAKSELARRITSVIEQRGLTQTKAAEILGVDQPKISAIKRGRLAGFSLERLMKFLILLGCGIQIVIKPLPGPDTNPPLHLT